MIRLAALIGVFVASAATAEPLDTAEKFQRYVGQGTMFFHRGDGQVYAAETYLSDQRVRWSLEDGETCLDGGWFASRGKICFVYENNPVPQCWFVEVGAEGLIATSDAVDNPLRIFEAKEAQGRQLCQGPKVGV